ncbi:hypothetical protein PoB_006774800 [Plakobranchus ocellatus]|uniref:Uncharacterized protein n=1 Tax=Plakobranchus ocellatus TaxID=259542 RepID=A0AAV4DB04_9GAST|nr:hypothetical protein PoB_006774800 [Plakobranchus ocellatus]
MAGGRGSGVSVSAMDHPGVADMVKYLAGVMERLALWAHCEQLASLKSGELRQLSSERPHMVEPSIPHPVTDSLHGGAKHTPPSHRQPTWWSQAYSTQSQTAYMVEPSIPHPVTDSLLGTN